MIAAERLYPLLNGLVGGKMYPLVVPENKDSNPPYLVYQTISESPENSQDGYMGHSWVRVQIDLYHDNYDACLNLRNNVISTIDNNIALREFYGSTESHDHESQLFRQSIDYGFWQTMTDL